AWEIAGRLLGETFPNETRFWKAYALAQGSNVEAATRELQRFVAGAPDRVLPSAHVHLGWSLLATGRPSDAMASLRAAMTESTGSDKAWAIAALARALRATGRNDELLALARTTLKPPTSPDADGWLALWGAVLSVGRDDAQAETLFTLARARAPRDDVARSATLELAKLHLHAGRLRAGRADMTSVAP